MLTGKRCPSCAPPVHRDGHLLRDAAGDVTVAVDGTPAPKGSRTVGRRRDGTVFTRPASRGEAAWIEAVAENAAACRSRVGQLEPPYAVSLTFWLSRPVRPAHSHPSRHDLDKLVRSTLDGLVAGGLLVNYRHVTELRAEKCWARPGGREGVVVGRITRPGAAEAAKRRSRGTSGDEKRAA